MIFNMVVLSEYEDDNRMEVVTTPLSTWKRDLPKGLNSSVEGQSYFVICCRGVVSFRQIDTRRDSGLELSTHRLCNLVHCCSAAIGAMASEPYCRSMVDRPSDEDVSRQILGVFMRHRIPATGTLQRNYFFEVRDGDFQRGINKAVANNWITIDLRNRYRYQLTTTGYAVGRMMDPVLGA